MTVDKKQARPSLTETETDTEKETQETETVLVDGDRACERARETLQDTQRTQRTQGSGLLFLGSCPDFPGFPAGLLITVPSTTQHHAIPG